MVFLIVRADFACWTGHELCPVQQQAKLVFTTTKIQYDFKKYINSKMQIIGFIWEEYFFCD